MDDSKDGKGAQWSCTLCTYKNIGGLKCDLCNTPRDSAAQIVVDADAVRAQVELLTPQWACRNCTFLNLDGAKSCVKCETIGPPSGSRPAAAAASLLPAASTPPHVMTTTAAPTHQRSLSTPRQFEPRDDFATSANAARHGASSAGTSLKWKCSQCTYLNFVSAVRCTMCSTLCSQPRRAASTFGGAGDNSVRFATRDASARPPADARIPVKTFDSNHTKSRQFLLVGCLSRYVNLWTGQSEREALFFRCVGSIVTKDANSLGTIVTYIVNGGNTRRALNYFEATIVYDFAVDVPVQCGDTLLTLAVRCGLDDVQKLLERFHAPEDNLPCAAASPTSEIYTRIAHVFHFSRSPYNIAIRPYDFNIFRLPLPKNAFTCHLLNEILQHNFDSSLKQSLIRYVQIAIDAGDDPRACIDPRMCNVISCPSTLVMRNRGGTQSLYDAVLQAMFGVCDRQNTLRAQLHDHINNNFEQYKKLFVRQYTNMAANCVISFSELEVDEFWAATVTSTVNARLPPEPIHIFALSHLIKRPIVVLPIATPIDLSKRPCSLLSLATSRSYAYHVLEGLYVPYFCNEVITRSPICLIHDNGQFYNWVSNDESVEHTQNFLIVNYLRTQGAALFRFVEDADEKTLRNLLRIVQLTPNSIAIHHQKHDCTPEVVGFYFDYLNAAEQVLKRHQTMHVTDIMRSMATIDESNAHNQRVTQLLSSTAKRMLSRRRENSLYDNSQAALHDCDTFDSSPGRDKKRSKDFASES